MKYNILIGLICFLFFYCSSKKQENKKDAPSIVVEKFYSWYLDSLYENGKINTPDVVLTKDSVYRLDGTKFISLLRQSEFFSQSFIQDQQNLIQRCDDDLNNSDAQKMYKEAGFMAVESRNCSFMNYFPWIGGQGEEIKKVNIISSKIEGDKAKIIVKAIETVSIELLRDNTKWKIEKIYIP
ncbi:MAG TPA: hypothetical protein VNW99_08580 [Cytophagaceae bacterium]|jgi:hypothetical protein|nr:hypothetical protein [Cytophagaceae bacterium]